jgi:hypothetical protein
MGDELLDGLKRHARISLIQRLGSHVRRRLDYVATTDARAATDLDVRFAVDVIEREYVSRKIRCGSAT